MEKKDKNLLASEQPLLHLEFTLSNLPEKVSPKPIMIELPCPFNTAENNSRACLFVKDPESDFKK